MRATRPGLGVKVAILVVSGATTLLVAEIALRLSGIYPSRPSQDETLFAYHPALGWHFIPNKTARVVSPGEFEGMVRINSAGMRDGECAEEKSPGARRIAVLGDSFVSNLDVREREVFTEVMETLLPPTWQVLNFGVNGFGPVQCRLLLEERVIRYRPEIALMLVFIGNDFDDNGGALDWISGYARPKAKLAPDGEVRIETAPSPSPARPESAGDWGRGRGDDPWRLRDAYKRFVLYHFVRDRLYYTFRVSIMPEMRLCRKSLSPEAARSYALMEGVIAEFGDFCRRRGIEPVVVIAPTIAQVRDGAYWARMKRKCRLADRDYDLEKPCRFIGEVCRRRGLRSLDLTPALRARARAGDRLYYRRNRHWDRAGNRLVAETICRYLVECGLVEPASAAVPGAGSAPEKIDRPPRAQRRGDHDGG